MTKSYDLQKRDEYCVKPVLITRHPVMEGLINKVKLLSKTRTTILITGENGTGKEIFARLFHYHSNRWEQPMISINAGAIPSELVESELFGHEKGAFTGAVSRKEGCFEMADKGILFLDEIGEMPLSAQVKLLRAVELMSFRRVGGNEEISVNVSLITASNKILIDQVKSGSFREDLYYRLNVVELYIPPLRHRKEDIPLLLSYYSNFISDMYGVEPILFDKESMEMLIEYNWPGNIRELRNVVERSVALYNGEIIHSDMLPVCISGSLREYSDFSDHVLGNVIRIPVGTPLDAIERIVIEQTLEHVKNNKTEAARILCFTRKTLHNKLKKYRESGKINKESLNPMQLKASPNNRNTHK